MANKSSKKSKIIALFQLPEAMLVGSFAGVILAGAILLTLPWAARSQRISFVDALFTSTSAVCVTGLIVVDTGTAYSLFGQIVILVLIQTGGLGIMTFAGLFFQLLLGRRMSLKSQALLHGSLFQQDVGVSFKQLFKQILWIMAITEFTGAVLLFAALLWGATPPAQALFSSVFHSVSAFCNAGFSIYSDNLVGVRDSRLFTFTIMGLIIIGGLGHVVVREIGDKFRNGLQAGGPGGPKRLSVHTRVVLRMSATLIVLGALGLLILGLTNQEPTWGVKIHSALFQSVTARTAGFNTVDIGALPLASILLLIFLMFVGGSPASCAGGIKTTALAILLADLRAKLKGEKEARLLDRRISPDIIARVTLLVQLAIGWIVLGLFLLLVTEARTGIGLHDVLFELVSAFGTVGLSTGITDKLTVTGKLWISATMFLGRLGPLTLAIWMFPKEQTHVKYPDGRILIG
ncbi:MAG: ATPase [Deltaproteobacteria bacterium]|nr:ATPase [Deltaproteobacteria bacterium]